MQLRNGSKVRIIHHEVEANIGKVGYAYYAQIHSLHTKVPQYAVLPSPWAPTGPIDWGTAILCGHTELEIVEDE